MRFDAVVFDLGNTLVPWRKQETFTLYTALQEAFETACGPMPDFFQTAAGVRDRLIAERENTSMREITVEDLVLGVCDGNAPDGLVDAVEDATCRIFDDVCRIPDYVHGVLEQLGRDRPLALLSNFYLTQPIETSLKHAGLWDRFVHVEVSATSGLAKPHPSLFDTVRQHLDTPMERILMVGDEFWADIVGGHRAGFLTALTHEHRQGPTSDARAPEVSADRIITNLKELL